MAKKAPNPKLQDKLLKSLRHCLKDFTNDFDSWEGDAFLKQEHVEIPPNLSPPPYIVFLTFVGILEFRYWGRWEKTAWMIPVSYRDVPLLLSHQKFGFRIHSLPQSPPSSELVREMLVQLNRSLRIADGLLQSDIQEQLENGHITVVNSYVKLSNMYKFFRDSAKRSYKRKPSNPKVFKRDEAGNPIASVYSPWKYKIEGFYYSVAMIDAFFSRLEHLLILTIPFVRFDASKYSLPSLINSNWTEKYKFIFDLTSDKVALRHYEQLRNIKDRYRNIFSHGFFQKDEASLFVHMPVVGAIPAYLSTPEENIQLSIVPISQIAFRQICQAFDSFDRFIRSSNIRFGMRFVEAGLDVAFDSNSVSKYLEATESDAKFYNFIEYQSCLCDSVTNMDWWI